MKRVLIIEDNTETLNELQEEFRNAGIQSICCNDNDSAQNALNDNIPLDAVILDWYFVLDNSPELSKNILKKLKQKCFIPVFVYTGHLADFQQQSEDELGYPKNMIKEHDKLISVSELMNSINSMLVSNTAFNLSVKYREKIQTHLENVFFDLNNSENSSLGKILKTIYGDGENIDWNNDIILTMLHRSLISDDEFTKEIAQILSSVDHQGTTDIEFNKNILSKILYHYGKSDYIRNGDIVKILKADDNSIIHYGIVVTPDCDLEQNKTRYLELIELKEITTITQNEDDRKSIMKNFKHGQFYPFPAIKFDGSIVDLVAVFKSKLIIESKEKYHDTKYPDVKERIFYCDEFNFRNDVVKIEFVCSKVNPYKAEFLQKLHSNNSRVGIPDIKELL